SGRGVRLVRCLWLTTPPIPDFFRLNVNQAGGIYLFGGGHYDHTLIICVMTIWKIVGYQSSE
ncbi:hypothetical protein, partial [Escherichia coli]|uniref:hypothetical protein n=1 Tax=Escherichia coli TaxID=562 RepID=UPI001BC8523D